VSRHDTDVVGFFFGVCFLVCAGLAIGVRTGNLGFASDGPDGAWIAGALLAVVGLIGVVGTLSGLRRRSAAAEAGTATAAPHRDPAAPPPSVAGSAEPPVRDDRQVGNERDEEPASGAGDLDADQTQVLDPPDPVEQ
jgi:hypothetical protein